MSTVFPTILQWMNMTTCYNSKMWEGTDSRLIFRLPDTFVKPNLWLLVNPSIACPIQYGESSANPQTLLEAGGENQTPLTEPAENRHRLPTELHVVTPQSASAPEHLLQSSSEYMVLVIGVTEYTYSSTIFVHFCTWVFPFSNNVIMGLH